MASCYLVYFDVSELDGIMIILQMCGGLGNQMFQYACYSKLISLGKEVKIDDVTSYGVQNARPIQLSVFDITYPRATREEVIAMRDSSPLLKDIIRRKLCGRKLKQYVEENYCFDRKVFDLDDTYLIGYFQSEEYFSDIKDDIRSKFIFEQSYITDETKQFRDEILQQENSVSIHVRRGDYNSSDAGNLYSDICTDEYYDAAIHHILNIHPDAIFYLFTNDHSWVEFFKNLHPDADIRFIDVSTEYTGYLDMYLMSNCKHHIIANSSFSWWGAWLGREEGITIAPSPWLNSEYCSDIYTNSMIKIDAKGNLVNGVTANLINDASDS